eukprot:TRINITY_DN1852_c0_g1_i2.p2 TRINITY_DN1852_c0_g1~~TRINITY_DN1852_c0_g1_i2.p2  ORF type:complete len:110 (+),score=20.25 TRINITY_DN1852_c0_g1_i2:135-464(+)
MIRRSKLLSAIIICIFCFNLATVYADDEVSGPVIGIDLGTTYSCVGVFKKGRVEIIANDQGSRVTPSWVAFTEDGERLVGESAKNQASTNPTNTIYDIEPTVQRTYSTL